MASADWISLGLRICLTVSAIIILGLICRIDVKLSQARIKYIVAVGTIGTALDGVVGIPLEFYQVRASRWILCVFDNVSWMLLIAAAIIAADDIHNASAAAKLGLISHEVVHLVKAATAWAFAGFAFALFASIWDFVLISKGDQLFNKNNTALPLPYTANTNPQEVPTTANGGNQEPSPVSSDEKEAV